MKKIEAIVHPSTIGKVKQALTEIGVQRMRISKVDEYGIQNSHKEFYRGRTFMVDVEKELKIELTVATDETLQQVIEVIEENSEIEFTGPSEIFISAVEEVVPFRRGETKQPSAH